MTNPPPRPALRKAPDADLHPALPPRVAAPPKTEGATRLRHPVDPTSAPLTPAEPPARPAKHPKRGKGRTSDTLRGRRGSAAPAAASPAQEKTAQEKAAQDKARGEKPRSDKGKPDKHDSDKGDKNKTVVVEVPMPKSLRRALDAQADALGYSREEAVLLLLRAWLEG